MKKSYNKFKQGGLGYLVGRAIHSHFAEKPYRYIRGINRAYNYWRSGVEYNPDGIDIFEEDWDNLLILDACRYDQFKQLNPYNGELQSRISRGSKTPEFLRGNFQNKTILDTVYLTTNAQYSLHQDDLKSKIFYHELIDYKNRKHEPLVLNERVYELYEEFNDKRFLIHYTMPHSPYVDDNGEELFTATSSPFKLAIEGHTKDSVVKAYNSTLRYVLSEIEPIINFLDGKTVISSDHGHLFGERGRPLPYQSFGHPDGNWVENLVKVPWFTIQADERRNIKSAERPTEWENEEQAKIKERLQHLGYG